MPNCPFCQRSVDRVSTRRTGHIYFRCTPCSAAWWPNKSGHQLGKGWPESRPIAQRDPCEQTAKELMKCYL